jgi:hypothetical protein
MSTIKSVLTLACILSICVASFGKDSDNYLAGFWFDGDDVGVVLRLYGGWSGCDLVVSSDVKKLSVPIWFISEPQKKYSTPDAARVISVILQEQAGIVITPLGGNRVSVTYNDQLPIKKQDITKIKAEIDKEKSRWSK